MQKSWYNLLFEYLDFIVVNMCGIVLLWAHAHVFVNNINILKLFITVTVSLHLGSCFNVYIAYWNIKWNYKS